MKRKYPDGPRIKLHLVILGQMMPRRFPTDPLAFICGIARQYGDIAHFAFGPQHVYQLNHPALIRQVVVEQAEKFHKPRLLKWALRHIAREGLLTSDGALRKQQRKLIQPALQHDRLGIYAQAMVEQTQNLLSLFHDGEVRDIGVDMSTLTLGIVMKTLFGSDLPGEARGIGDAVTALLDATNKRLNGFLHVPSWVPTVGNRREKRAIAEVESDVTASDPVAPRLRGAR